MLKITRNFLLISVLVVVAQACAPQGVPSLDANAIGTAIAGTSAAALTQTAQVPFPITGGEASTSVRDTVTNTVLSSNSDDFINNGCSGSDPQDNLPTGATRIVSSPVFTDNLAGPLQAAITVCSNPGQSGTCVSQVINFTP